MKSHCDSPLFLMRGSMKSHWDSPLYISRGVEDLFFTLTNSVNVDEMKHYAAFHLGLHCL